MAAPDGDDAKKMKQGGAIGCLVLLGLCALPYACSDTGEQQKPAPPSGATQAVPASGDAKAEMKLLYGQVLDLAKPCDSANSEAADAVQAVGKGGASVYDAYGKAQAGEKVCQESWLELGKLEPPDSIEGEAREKLTDTLKTCELAYFARKNSLGTMAKFIDGDQRPSMMQQFKEDAERGQAGTMVCVAGLVTAASAVGLEMADLTGETGG